MRSRSSPGWRYSLRTFAPVALPALFVALALAPGVDANMMYSYVGDTFRSNVAEELTGVYTLADRITGWLIVTDGFVPRLTAYTQDVTPGCRQLFVHGRPPDVDSGEFDRSFRAGRPSRRSNRSELLLVGVHQHSDERDHYDHVE